MSPDAGSGAADRYNYTSLTETICDIPLRRRFGRGWLVGFCVALLLTLLLRSGVLTVRFLSELREQEIGATHALAERARALSGLWLSIQSYDRAVQDFVEQSAARNAEASMKNIIMPKMPMNIARRNGSACDCTSGAALMTSSSHGAAT